MRVLVISPPALRTYVLLMFYSLLYSLVISVRPIISTSTRPTFTKCAGLVELWPLMNELKLFFRPLNERRRGNYQFVLAKIDLHSTPCSLHDIRRRHTTRTANVAYTDIAKFAGHLPHCYGNSRAIWDHTVLPATRQR